VSSPILLRALDGSNPLAFLAALGTLRLLHLNRSDGWIEMYWEYCEGSWRPKLNGLNTDESGLCDMLVESPYWAPIEEFRRIGRNLTVPIEEFSPFVRDAQECATRLDRRTADFAAAFGCEICEDKKKSRMKYTNFCFITGSGHQDFLGTIDTLASRVTSSHIRDALFGNWRAEKGLSMRWDPSDAAEYALRWDDPGPQGAWAVWGANRLAAEALPYFPTMPTGSRLETTGFRFNRSYRQAEFTWPIWTEPIGFDAIRSLVSLAELQTDEPPRGLLREMGIGEVFRAQRVRIGQGPKFKVSFRAACSV